MADDVVKNINGSTETNGSVVVGAPKAAGTDAFGSNYTIDPTINSVDSNVGSNASVLYVRYQTRFDDRNYAGLAE